MADRKALGDWGEARAAEYLEARGCRILARNYRSRYGELDIVASCGRFLLFAEVKLRKNADFGYAMEAVTPAKQRRLRTTALLWLQENPTELQPRFDVIEVYAPLGAETKNPDIHHIPNAF